MITNGVNEGDIIPKTDISKNDLLEAYQEFGSFAKAAPNIGIGRKLFSKLWKQNGLPHPSKIRISTSNERFSFAVISDLHIGSNQELEFERDQFIRYAKSKGITTLLCGGDICDGLYDGKRKDHVLQRYLHSPDEILEKVVEVYPEGFDTNIFINGNHDLSLMGFDLGNHIIKMRKDLTYLTNGYDNPYINEPIIVDGGAKVVLYHGVGSCTKILETRMRNITDTFISMNKWADFYLFGHCHKYGEKRDYLGNTLISLPCFQGITRYISGKPLVPNIGGLIFRYNINQYGNPCNVAIEYVNQYT